MTDEEEEDGDEDEGIPEMSEVLLFNFLFLSEMTMLE